MDDLTKSKYYVPLVKISDNGCWFVGGDDLTGALHDL